MDFKIVILLVGFVLGLSVLVAFYNAVIYPIRQFFKRKNEFGYILIGLGGYEHRACVQRMIGRDLLPDEEVHHINGKKWDNKRGNLALMTRENHQRWHGRLSWMYERKMFPTIKTQRKKLIEEFEATIF